MESSTDTSAMFQDHASKAGLLPLSPRKQARLERIGTVATGSCGTAAQDASAPERKDLVAAARINVESGVYDGDGPVDGAVQNMLKDVVRTPVNRTQFCFVSWCNGICKMGVCQSCGSHQDHSPCGS